MNQESPRARAVLLCLAAVCWPVLVFLGGRLCIWGMRQVPPVEHAVPCPLCHGTRAFEAFYGLQVWLAARENLFVCVGLVIGSTVPVLVAGLLAVSRPEEAQRRLSRLLGGVNGWAVLAAGLAIVALQWLINIRRPAMEL